MQGSQPPSEAAPNGAPVQPSTGDRVSKVETVLSELLRLMDVKAAVEVKEGPGGVLATLVPSADAPELATGRRSPLLDSLQLVVNKMVSRPSMPRLWVSLSVGGDAAGRLSAPETVAPVEVPPDPLVDGLGRSMGEKAATFGWRYAVLGMSAEDRARMVKAGEGLEGVTVAVEGEGRSRRVVFTPRRLAKVPRLGFPADDEEEG